MRWGITGKYCEYHAHRSNVHQQVNINTRLSKIIPRNVLKYFGHITRRKEGLERLMVEGGVEGRRSRGTAPSRWFDRIKKITWLSLPEASHKAQHRDKWSIAAKQASWRITDWKGGGFYIHFLKLSVYLMMW